MVEEPDTDETIGGWQRRDVAKAALGIGGASTALALAVPATGMTDVLSREFTGEIYADRKSVV